MTHSSMQIGFDTLVNRCLGYFKYHICIKLMLVRKYYSPGRLDVKQDAHRLHDQLDGTGRVLEALHEGDGDACHEGDTCCKGGT